MAKQLNVDLNFRANTEQAKKSIMELQNALTKISLNSNATGIDPTKMKEASTAARELSIHLNNAFNANTGKLDLSKLNKSLKTSSTNVTELSTKLLNAGAQGQQAFVQLAQSIAAADRPVVTLNSKFAGLLTTLKNTARWQLSSSVLHGFMGAYQQAMGYVKDLNESLTDIRIVTGKSIDDMTRFAEEANKAAKTLSTTTNEYAKASLIFYQQGLNDAEVAKRTEVTVKMANATGQTAQVVSDQLTAVWNNFYDGSQSLEHYADVMTALGAATASSTDEIAGGLEKFAAIADTIGLSYEYAASALATITANTRQSEDVVGTALKTIFARIQGLNLGETLDDGTTLNKYSEALQKVGISIFDQAGELKNMDAILEEMGSKWTSLSKDQQIALAQTVAGVRQYNQLVALMDNWDVGDSDSMKANLATAYGAEGTLQEQADIYAESWEAARDRVKASLESIYGQVLDDEFFIDISNGFSGLLDSVSAFIDGIGGIKTIVVGIGSVLLSSIANKIQPALMELKHTFSIVFQTAEQQARNLANEMNQSIDHALDPKSDYNLNDTNKVALENAKQMNLAKAKMQTVENSLTTQEKQRFDQQLQMIQLQQQETQEVANRITKLKEEKEAILDMAATEELTASGKKAYKEGSKEVGSYITSARRNLSDAEDLDGANAAIKQLTEARQAASQYEQISQQVISSINEIDNAFRSMGSELNLEPTNQQIQDLNNTIQNSLKGNLTDIKENLNNVGDSEAGFESVRNQINLLIESMPSVISQTEGMQDALNDVFTARTPEEMAKAIEKVEQELEETTIDADKFAKILKEINPERFNQLRDNVRKTNKAEDDLKKKQEELNKLVEGFNPKHVASGIEGIVKTASGLGQVAMAAQSVRSIFKAWSNDDLSFGEKITTTLISISMALPALKSGLSGVTAGFTSLLSTMAASMSTQMATKILAEASAVDILNGKITAENLAKEAGIALETAEMMIKEAKVKTIVKEAIANDSLTSAETKEQIAKMLGITTDEAAIIVSKMAEGATLAEALAETNLTTAKTGGIAATVAEIVAKGEATGATWAQVVANIALQTSLPPLLVLTLLLVAAMAALAAAIAIVVTAVKAIVAAYNADAIAAEKAEASAKGLAEAYNEAKQSYEDMVAAMEEYQTAREALDSLTEGAEGYKEALENANRAALELINNNPGLFNEDDYHWENGQLIVDEDAMARAEQAAAKKESQAYAAMQMGQAEAKEARNTANETQLRRDMRKDSFSFGDYVETTRNVAVLGAMTGPIGAAIATAVITNPLLSTALTKGIENKKSDSVMDKAMAEYKKDNSFFERSDKDIKKILKIEDDDLIKALRENQDALMRLSDSQEAQVQQEKLAAQQSANAILQDSAYSDRADEMTYMGGAVLQEATDKAYESILGSMKNKSGLKSFADEYFANSGISDKNGFQVEKYNAKKGTVTYSYFDDQGKRQEAEVTAEQIAMTKAVTMAEQDLLNSCEAMSKTFDALDADIKDTSSSTRTLSEGMKEFLTTGDTNQLTKAQYDAMAGMDSKQMVDYLASIGITDKNIKDFGYDNVTSMISDMDLDTTGDQWQKYEHITSKAGTENLTLDQAERINSAIESVADFFSEELGEKMLDLSSTMADSLEGAAQDEFWKQLGNISDYTDADQWDAFLEAMKASGDLTEEQVKQLENYVDSAKLAAKATKDLNFNEMAESIKGLRGVMENIKDGSREISDEEFEMLSAQGIDTSKFAKTIDGYRYLGNSGELVEDIARSITNKFQEAESNFENIVALAEQSRLNYEEATAAAEAGANSAQDGANVQLTNTQKMNMIMGTIVNGVVTKIKATWEQICGKMLEVYDFFATFFNAVGQGITDAWNSFLTVIENIINGAVGAVVSILEKIPGVDMDWEDVNFEKASFEKAKTSEDIELEEAEKDFVNRTQEITNALPELLKSIEASADSMSREELELGKSETEEKYKQASSDYDAAVLEYGEDSAQAEYYKTLKDAYEQQIESYVKALDSKAWGEMLDDLDPKEVEELAESFKSVDENSEIFSTNLAENEGAAREAAKQLSRYNRAVETAVDNMDDWKKALKGNDLAKQTKAVKELGETYADMFDLDPDDFSEGFLKSTKNLELMEKALDGSEEAYNALQTEVAMDIIGEKFGELPGITKEMINDITSQKIKAGDLIDFDSEAGGIGGQLFNMYNEAITAAQIGGASVAEAMAEANALMQAVGFEPPEVEMEEKEITLTGDVPDGWTPQEDGSVTTTDADGNQVTVKGVRAVKTEGGTYEYKQTIMVPKGGGKITKSTENLGGGTTSGSGGGGGGGGGSEPKKADPTKKSDVVERYKRINDRISDQERAMDRASKAADRLWGPARIKQMEDANKALKKNIDLLKKKRSEAIENLEIDRQALQDTLAENGASAASFDSEDNIKNYESIMEGLYNELKAAEDAAGDEWDESEQETIDAIQERIDAVKEAIEQYDETNNLIKDLNDEIQDAIYEWQDNNYEILTAELEFKVEINDSKLELVEYYLNKIEDSLYDSSDAFEDFSKQQSIYTDNLKNLENHVADLEKQYYEGKISLDAYKEGLREAQSATIENLEALEEVKEAMSDYYSNYLTLVQDEIAKYTDRMEHLNDVLDHYSNILEIIGKQKDFDMQDQVLGAIASNIKNELDVQTKNYQNAKEEVDEWATKMASVEVGSDEYKEYEKNWLAAQEVMEEAQSAMLEKTEEWAEAMRAVIENQMAKAADAMEKALTGGKSFEEVLTSMERRSSLQEEYLTTTNKIYETNKLMNKVQQDIDKSTNTAAKRRLSDFVKETKKLQEKTQLSEYELKIQQAKYDLLLAEIALEEAQNAKSTVRLQRDSEGNFGYVYTADSEAVSNAEQNLADKQNALYNIGLQGANEYMQKYAETMQEAQDAITELTMAWMNGEIESEAEYLRKKEELQTYYYDKLKGYSELYQIALTTDSMVVADAWASDFSSMVVDTETWKIQVGQYFTDAETSVKQWQSVCLKVSENTGLDKVAETIQDVKDKSNDLKTTLIGENGDGGVVKALKDETTAVRELSSAYIEVQKQIDETIAHYENMLDELNKKYADENTPVVEPQIPTEDEKPKEEEPKEEEEKPKYDSKTKRGVALAIWNGGYGWGTGNTRRSRLKEKGFDPDEIQNLVNNTNPSAGWEQRYGISSLKKYSYSSFDTGGYTGDWGGPEGKFAMLHQKELVLNQGDTENFLSAMSILDKIVSAIDLYSMNAQLGGLLSSPSIGNMNSNDVLEQQVHIEASFPNVQNRSEIEEAFNTLVNRASQYANRK